MRIMLFGGAFDPPHSGHKLAAETVLQKGLADEVWFVPCFQHPFDKTMSPAKDRVAMLSLLKVPRTRVCRYEIDQETMSYSLDTLQHFASIEPQHTFSWMIGSDNLEKFNAWHDYETLLKRFQVFVYPRVGFPFNVSYPHMTFIKNVPEIATSSTQVRIAVQNGERIDQFVGPRIARYIEQYSLYTTHHG